MKQLNIRRLRLALGVWLTVGALAGAAEVDFEQQVLPTLRDRCFKCHGEKKQKGDLRFDTKAGAFATDYVIVPGDPDQSEMLSRITLPADDETAMPPNGERLTAEQIQHIRAWIAAGAEWPNELETITSHSSQRKSPLETLPPIEASPAEAAAIERLAAMGVQVRPVAQEFVWKTANLRGVDRQRLPEVLGSLAEIKTLTDLNLAGRDLTDEDVAKISTLTNLTRLHLENNSISDAALVHLAPLVHLDYLNLYGTNVGNSGLSHLTSMRRLRKLYLWQSQVTEEGVAALNRELPDVEVVLGATLFTPPAAAGDNAEGAKEGEPGKEVAPDAKAEPEAAKADDDVVATETDEG